MTLLALRALYPTYFEGEGGGSPGVVTPPAAAADGPWYQKAGVAAEHHEWLHAKQFADPSIMTASYRSMEKLVGRQRIAVPNDTSEAVDTEAWNAIYKTLGRPETADGYKLKDGSKITGDAFRFMAPVFHAAGIGQAQAEKVLGAYEAEAIRLQTAADTERKNIETADITKLDTEWGSKAEANKDIAARAFRALGIDAAISDKIESAIGYSATMKLFHAIGSGMKEPAFHQDGTKGGGMGEGGTVAGIQAKIKDKLSDKDFVARYTHPSPATRKTAIDEMEVLQKQAAQLAQGGGR